MSKRKVLESVYEFMDAVDTRSMNNNRFIVEYCRYRFGHFNNVTFLGLQLESLTRARRFYIMKHPDQARTMKDTEEAYVEAFSPINP